MKQNLNTIDIHMHSAWKTNFEMALFWKYHLHFEKHIDDKEINTTFYFYLEMELNIPAPGIFALELRI